MQKPSRKTVKNASIAVGVLGTVVVATAYSNHLVSTFYKMKMERTEMLMVLDKIATTHPQLVKEAVEASYAEVQAALAPLAS